MSLWVCLTFAGISKLCFEQDCEPVWRARDDAVKSTCRETGVVCREHVSHTLWEPDTVIRYNGGIPPLTYQMFLVSLCFYWRNTYTKIYCRHLSSPCLYPTLRYEVFQLRPSL
ncbi:Cryptochrome-1 [Papilio machaon]|uniref:Cryptochrome-1 n=1 Tax=Papilio machaon TaxID=76193 RepID=A0A0N0PF97_PAPMA|nr:Cryptochrome-1 [Papilio machaon]